MTSGDPFPDLRADTRPSDHPLVDQVWQGTSDHSTTFVSLADIPCGLVVSHVEGRVWVTVRGPETRWSSAFAPAGGRWLGIDLIPGSFLTPLLPSKIMNRQDVTFEASRVRGFSWEGARLEVPHFDNVEDLVRRLERLGVLHYDPVVADVLAHRPTGLSERAVQRRFRRATGLVPSEALQILRVREAARRVRRGHPLAEVSATLGYYDQSHMTKAFARWIGLTPARVALRSRPEVLSYL